MPLTSSTVLFIFLAHLFPQILTLKCRTDPDLKTLEEFEDIVRSCLKIEDLDRNNTNNRSYNPNDRFNVQREYGYQYGDSNNGGRNDMSNNNSGWGTNTGRNGNNDNSGRGVNDDRNGMNNNYNYNNQDGGGGYGDQMGSNREERGGNYNDNNNKENGKRNQQENGKGGRERGDNYGNSRGEKDSKNNKNNDDKNSNKNEDSYYDDEYDYDEEEDDGNDKGSSGDDGGKGKQNRNKNSRGQSSENGNSDDGNQKDIFGNTNSNRSKNRDNKNRNNNNNNRRNQNGGGNMGSGNRNQGYNGDDSYSGNNRQQNSGSRGSQNSYGYASQNQNRNYGNGNSDGSGSYGIGRGGNYDDVKSMGGGYTSGSSTFGNSYGTNDAYGVSYGSGGRAGSGNYYSSQMDGRYQPMYESRDRRRGGEYGQGSGYYGSGMGGYNQEAYNPSEWDSRGSEDFNQRRDFGFSSGGTFSKLSFDNFNQNSPESRVGGNNNRKTGSPLDNVEPVNSDSYLDRRNVLSKLIRRARDPQLKEFIGDTVQKCFQRHNLEKMGRCEGAKMFALCMEEAGKMNCEDWDVNKKFGQKYPAPGATPVRVPSTQLLPPPVRG